MYIYICVYIYVYIYIYIYISIQINVATDEGNGRNEIGHGANEVIGVAVQSWL